MSRELTIEEKSETCGTSAMGSAGAPCSFGAQVKPGEAKPSGGVWRPVLAKLALGGLAIAAFAGLGLWSMEHEGRRPLSIPEAHASQNKGEWMAASAPSKPGSHGPAGDSKAGVQAVVPCPAASAAGVQSSPAGGSSAKTSEGKVVLNSAVLADLVKLPGVGPKRAQAILDLRTRLGRFRKVSDLLRVKGIGVKGIKKLEPLVVIDAPVS